MLGGNTERAIKPATAAAAQGLLETQGLQYQNFSLDFCSYLVPGWRNGRRVGLKIRFREECEFESRSGYHTPPSRTERRL